ncbi:DUF1993 family protein [Enterovibrio calviensis]|uniref:DUF1993 family protein n=1 Tax=Enterovibrio calviensis TaxID=91359 RepID=UPI0004856AD0|nr:DUF1993 family protein [Enterovibrio calviensis]
MNILIKDLFLRYLHQLGVIIDKTPDNLFADALSEGMFSLELNAQVAANFLLRGYSPIASVDLVSYELNETGKGSVCRLLERVKTHLESLPDITELDDSKIMSDSAGFSEVNLPQSRFVFEYIIPNYMFHASMVYAIARKNGTPLSKGDFDGLHSYPVGFKFDPI